MEGIVCIFNVISSAATNGEIEKRDVVDPVLS